MATTTITSIAVPKGRSTQTLRLSAFLSLRLVPDPPSQETTLGAQFPWVVSPTTDWPALIAATSFDVTVGAESFSVDPQPPLESALFRRLFTEDTRVTAFSPTDLSGLPVFSWPVQLVHDTLKAWYGKLGAAAGDSLPTVEDLRDAFGHNELTDLWAREGPNSLAGFRERVRKGEVGPSTASWLDAFRLLALFHYPPAETVVIPASPSPGQGQWSSAKKVDLPSAEELAARFADFHQVLAALNAYPTLLRRLGFVVDLEVTSPTLQDGPLALTVTPTGDGWSQLPVETVVATTAAVLTATDLRAESSSGLLTGGMLQLGDPRFGVVQVDVDGLALKAINFAATLAGTPEHSEPGEPRTLGAPAARTGGLALVHTGLQGAVADVLSQNKALNDLIDQAGTVDLTAEDLARGFPVDVLDGKGGRWRSLCQRTGRYLPIDGGPELDPIDDEGAVQLAVTQAPDAETTGQDQLYVPETLVDWKGWSLVAPRPGKRINPDDSVTPGALPAGEVTEDADPPPPGIPLHARFEPKKGSLPRLRYGRRYQLRLRVGDIAGNAIPYQPDDIPGAPVLGAMFRRFEPVPPPTLALVQGNSPELPQEGEAMARLAIRTFNDDPSKDGDPMPATAERLVFPPVASQVTAETHGMFDVPVTQPDGTPGVGLDKGGYPLIVSKDGALMSIEAPLGPSPPPDATPASYAIAGVGHATPYLPDPLSRRVALRWLDRLGQVLAEIAPVEWYAGQGWPHAASFRIRLEQGAGAASFDAADRILHAPVPKGEARVLRVSSQFDPADLELLGLWTWIADEFVPAPGQPDLVEVRKRAVAGQHWMLTPWRDVEVVHAVQQPIGTPLIVKLHVTRQLGATWAGIPFQARIHRASTAKVDMHGNWYEPVDDPEAAAGPSFTAREARAFEVRVPLRPEAGEGQDELERLERYHRHEFGDTRYRRVRYHVSATSRYREYFDPTANLEFSRSSDTVEGVIPNSARPAPPRVLYAVPTFGWQVDEQGVRHRRGGGLRVYLDRPWFSSGFGELLGVVLPVQHNLDDLRGFVSEWGSDPFWESPAVPAALLTIDRFPRARTKPEDTDVPSFAPPGELPLPDGPFDVDGLTLPRVDVPVNVAPHDVAWDPDRRLWYSDIEVTIGDAYFPIIRLALARYHPVSVGDAHLSQVVLLDFMQLAPDRKLAVTASDTAADTWIVTLSGPGYTASSATVTPGAYQLVPPIIVGSELLPTGNVFTRSRVRLGVERLDHDEGEDFGWRADPSAVVTTLGPPPGALWHGSVELPGGIPPGERRIIVITESEQYIADADEKGADPPFRLGERITYADIVPLP